VEEILMSLAGLLVFSLVVVMPILVVVAYVRAARIGELTARLDRLERPRPYRPRLSSPRDPRRRPASPSSRRRPKCLQPARRPPVPPELGQP
jgi:hypothetical protein